MTSTIAAADTVEQLERGRVLDDRVPERVELGHVAFEARRPDLFEHSGAQADCGRRLGEGAERFRVAPHTDLR